MLNINDPRSEYIFKAAGFLDRLKEYCRQYILQSFEERQETFLKMEMECDQLNAFAREHFTAQLNVITELTDALKSEVHRLRTINNTTEEGNCTVCNTPLTTIDTLIRNTNLRFITICENCSNELFDLINKLEVPTEVMWI